jgi:2-isopropylmalate synthase
VQSNKAVVGQNAFVHSSGIHQDGIAKHRATYEFIAPEAVGVAGHRFVLTARSGRAAIVHEARRLGIEATPEQVEEIYTRFIDAADRIRGAVLRDTFESIVREVGSKAVHAEAGAR